MKARWSSLLFGLVLLGAGLAHAAEDGGLRSVFARGAGERALALGGAYGAIEGDATSLFWNPAGLADVHRNSFAAAHTNLIGMGFQEQFGVLAVPSWRLGTFAVALRRHGVDGIEGRDERGTLYADDLQDAQSELAVGYARSLGAAWRIGAAFKLQRQELAGESGSGLGLDAGVLVHPGVALGSTAAWTRGWTVGLAFRNLVEPTLRLVSDDVTDPAAIRFGTSLERPVGRHAELLVSLDIEKTRDMDANLHAGAELVLLDVLALRVGSHDGLFTAGLGAGWNGIDVHYAFEDNPLETVHRFGFAVGFGATTTERRQADRDRRDTELNTLLADAFASDQARRVAAAEADVTRALEAEEYDSALTRIRALAVLAPEHRGIARLTAAAHFGRGRTAEGADDLTTAALAYRAGLQADPDHPEAAARLAAVEAESERRAQRTESIRDLYRRAMDAYGAGDLEQARDFFAEAERLAPTDTEIRELSRHVADAIVVRDRAEAERAAAEEAARRAAETRDATSDEPAVETGSVDTPVPVVALQRPSWSDLDASRRREVADLYEQGVAAAAEGRRADAVRYWELVAAAAPDYQQVTEHLVQEYQAQGMEAFAAGRLDRAIEIWQDALGLDPDDERTRGYLGRAQEHRARILSIRGDGR